MSLIDRSLELSAVLLRPFSNIRAVGRVTKFIKTTHLVLGAGPIKTVQFVDGSLFKVDLRSQTEWYTYYSGRYDDYYIDILKALLKDGGNFIDVGANIGFYGIRIARSLTDEQTVFCFEPLPQNIMRLKENIKLNSLKSKIAVYEFGLSNKECIVDITLREDFESGSSTGNAAISISPDADRNFQIEKVRLKKLDDLMQKGEFGNVKLIKLDIEGHEDLFLQGAQEFIELQQPIIFCEINKAYYRWRKVDLDKTFQNVIPANYAVLKIKISGSTNCIEQVSDFHTLREIENVFLCPSAALDFLDQSVRHQH